MMKRASRVARRPCAGSAGPTAHRGSARRPAPRSRHWRAPSARRPHAGL